MNRIAYARLRNAQPARPRQCQVELIALDDPAAISDNDRCVVSVSQGDLRDGVVLAPKDSTLTAVPVRRDEAERRLLDFVRRRLDAGERLVAHEGLAALGEWARKQQQADDSEMAVTPAAVPSQPQQGEVPPAIAALVRRFSVDEWKLLDATRRSRTAWRVGEYGDPRHPATAAQKALAGLAPRLVALLETGDDMLDHCLAVALARLGDPGAAEALRHLSQRGRSPATQRAAHQAWLLLQPPEAQAAHASTLLPGWGELLERASPLAEI
jgi:hypothetical protein